MKPNQTRNRIIINEGVKEPSIEYILSLVKIHIIFYIIFILHRKI